MKVTQLNSFHPPQANRNREQDHRPRHRRIPDFTVGTGTETLEKMPVHDQDSLNAVKKS